MFRQPANNKPSASNNVSAKPGSNENSPTTIREIRSRTIGSTATNNARHLLANRRQAASMERLNGVSSPAISTIHNNNDREKSSPSSGSTNSINNSNVSSPLRSNAGGGGLNRTASRVSRFRSAKAVFERLSSSNNNSTKPDRPTGLDKPRGTVASRYAAAAAARATSHATASITPTRSRVPTGALTRSQDSGRSSSNLEINKPASSSHSNKSEINQPKPQPRVISNRTAIANAKQNIPTMNSPPDVSTKNRTLNSNANASPKIPVQAKPPPKDLIDKIVLEIVSDAEKQKPDPNCTIQDLSNCDISGIPETLDFDRCFQDVEMMTEEEARKLLSRKNSPPSPATTSAKTTDDSATVINDTNNRNVNATSPENIENEEAAISTNNTKADPSIALTDTDQTKSSQANKCKVRFSEDPVKIFDTHAVEDYDRRNDDIDPVAASAEYEIEKSKEREGIKDSDDEDSESVGAVKVADQFIQAPEARGPNNLGNPPCVPRTPHSAPHADSHDFSGK